MSLDAQQILQLKTQRTGSWAMTQWHDRMANTDQLYAGDVSMLFKDETTRRTELMVPNTVQLGLTDISWLVSESMVTLRCAPKKNTDQEKVAAQVKEAIGLTYRYQRNTKKLDPRLALDLVGTGAVFLLCHTSAGSKYPKASRLNPRNCFPDLGQLGQQFQFGVDPGVIDSELYDLVVVNKMPLRTANYQFGTNVGNEKQQSDEIEVVDYYSPDELVKVYQGVKDPKFSEEVQRATNVLGRIPVAFNQLDTLDGQFRGGFDQVGPIMKTLNRLYTLILDDGDRTIYDQPIFTPDVDKRTYGFPGEPIMAQSVEAAQAIRMLKAGTASPTLFPLLSQLERFIHIGAAYPETRGSEPNASIISSLGISATQGVLKSQVQNANRVLADTWEQWYSMAYALDVKELNFEKPLMRPVKNQYTYLPGKDIGDSYEVRVIYSAGQGIGDLNERVGHLQALGAGVVSKETVRENLKEVEDPLTEQQKIDYEQAQSLFLQEVLPKLDPATYAKALLLMSEGKTMREVYELISQQPPAPAEGAPQPTPEPGTTPPEQVQAEQTSLEKGGVPGQAPAQQPTPAFQPPPYTQIAARPF